MGKDVELSVDHAEAEDVFDLEQIKHSIEEHVAWQVIKTGARVRPGSAQGSRPGEGCEDINHCQQWGRVRNDV